MTAILPRRSFSPLLGRLLHDRTADKIAGVVSRVPNAAATIIPFDVQNRLHVLQERQAARDGQAPASLTPVPGPPEDGEQRHLQAAVAAAAPAEEAGAKPEPLPGAGEPRPADPAARLSPRSARSTSRARPPSRAGCGWSRSVRWNGTRCWPARSATPPAT